jgi:arsenite-transporting ATPase
LCVFFKGGVGKTTTSASLAIAMANAGHKVALVSTDPAHSVGDAIQIDLTGGKLIDVPLFGSVGEGSLSAMEIDPKSALAQFKGIVDSLISSDTSASGGSGSSQSFSSTLKSLGEIFDTLPAGTDEVVALAKVVGLVKKGGFDRIVLDTAPTGHTLRMLSTPSFIVELIDRVLSIADKVNSNPTVKLFLSGAAAARGVQSLDDTADAAKAELISFQMQMYDLDEIFSNEAQTEFLIVTIPTQLAVRESIRLLNDLSFESTPIKVRNIVVNQVLGEEDSEIFASRVANGQIQSIERLQRSVSSLSNPPLITKVGNLDSEPRGVFGLKALAHEMLVEEIEPNATPHYQTNNNV